MCKITKIIELDKSNYEAQLTDGATLEVTISNKVLKITKDTIVLHEEYIANTEITPIYIKSVLDFNLNMTVECEFSFWWDHYGSKIEMYDSESSKDYARRVAFEAWSIK